MPGTSNMIIHNSVRYERTTLIKLQQYGHLTEQNNLTEDELLSLL